MVQRPVNPPLNAAVLEIVDTQLREGAPPETGQTFARLTEAGYAPEAARRLIGCVVVSEIVEVLRRQLPYDEARFVAALQRLPRLPWEHEAGPDRRQALERHRAGSADRPGRRQPGGQRRRRRG